MADASPPDCLRDLISDLPESARMRIAALWTGLERFFEDSRAELEAEAEHLRASDPRDLDFWEATGKKYAHNANEAVLLVFAGIARQYLERGTLDTKRFISKLQSIADWLSRRFHLDRSSFNQVVELCEAALEDRRPSTREVTTEPSPDQPTHAVPSIADIEAALAVGKREQAVELWQSMQRYSKMPFTKKALEDEAGQHRRERRKWETGKLPHGSKADVDIRKVLLKPKLPT